MKPADLDPKPAPAEVASAEGHAQTGVRQGGSIIALSTWLESAPGRYALAWEQDRFDVLVSDIFGFNAVQIGLLQLPALRTNRMPLRFGAGDAAFDACPLVDARATDAPVPQVIVALNDLPFASQSMDLVVLPHVLEFADDPHRVLREVERVLIPEGHVVISGFNPVSLWGLRQVAGRSFGASFLPDSGQFLVLPRLKDWLKLLGFEVHRGHFGCYRPPFSSERWQGRFGFLEEAGRRWWPVCGAVYLVHAIKRVQGLRLIGPAWKDRKRPAAQLQPSVHRATERRAGEAEPAHVET